MLLTSKAEEWCYIYNHIALYYNLAIVSLWWNTAMI